MTNNLTSTEIRVNSDVCTTPLFENKDFLTQKYAAEGLSARQIAVLIGCSHSTINNALNRYGIQKEARKSDWIEFGFRLSNGRRVPHVREQNLLERMHDEIAKRASQRSSTTSCQTLLKVRFCFLAMAFTFSFVDCSMALELFMSAPLGKIEYQHEALWRNERA